MSTRSRTQRIGSTRPYPNMSARSPLLRGPVLTPAKTRRPLTSHFAWRWSSTPGPPTLAHLGILHLPTHPAPGNLAGAFFTGALSFSPDSKLFMECTFCISRWGIRRPLLIARLRSAGSDPILLVLSAMIAAAMLAASGGYVLVSKPLHELRARLDPSRRGKPVVPAPAPPAPLLTVGRLSPALRALFQGMPRRLPAGRTRSKWCFTPLRRLSLLLTRARDPRHLLL